MWKRYCYDVISLFDLERSGYVMAYDSPDSTFIKVVLPGLFLKYDSEHMFPQSKVDIPK